MPAQHYVCSCHVYSLKSNPLVSTEIIGSCALINPNVPSLEVGAHTGRGGFTGGGGAVPPPPPYGLTYLFFVFLFCLFVCLFVVLLVSSGWP